MGAKLGHGSKADDLDLQHEINVTPFIDVILVLLIIFMVAAPLATVDVRVQLPPSSARQQPRPDKPIFVTLRSDLSLTIGEDVVSREGLASALNAITLNNHEETIFFRSDKAVSYGDFFAVINLLRDDGYLKIGLVGLESKPSTP
jgi:TonB system transport protein ExbD (group 1)